MCRRHRSGYLNEDRLGRHRTDDTHFGQTDGVTISMTKIPNPTDKYVGSRVRMRRMMLGLSQEKLADGLGLTFQQIQKYEKGTNRISASRLQAYPRSSTRRCISSSKAGRNRRRADKRSGILRRPLMSPIF
jgi:DNA-binding XRE family transcriptional regulator